MKSTQKQRDGVALLGFVLHHLLELHSIHEQLFIYEVHHMRDLYAATTAPKSAALHETLLFHISLWSRKKKIYIYSTLYSALHAFNVFKWIHFFSVIFWYLNEWLRVSGTQQMFTASKRHNDFEFSAGVSNVATMFSLLFKQILKDKWNECTYCMLHLHLSQFHHIHIF